MLLERGDVNPDQVDTCYGRTPLLWAAENGHEGVVKILLERGDVNPDQVDTFYGRTPLSWAAENGYEGVVNMLLERKDVRAPMPDSLNQTPQRLALLEGHDGAATILQKQGNPNCAAVDCCGPTSFPRSTLPRDEPVVETQFRSHDPNTNSDGQHPPLQVAQNEQPRLPGIGDSVPKSTVTGLSAQSPWWSLPLFFIWPLNLRYSPRKPDAPPNTRSILSFPVTRSFILASVVCLLAFLLYIFPSLSGDMSSFR